MKITRNQSIRRTTVANQAPADASSTAQSPSRALKRPLAATVPLEVADQGRIRMGAGFRLPTSRG